MKNIRGRAKTIRNGVSFSGGIRIKITASIAKAIDAIRSCLYTHLSDLNIYKKYVFKRYNFFLNYFPVARVKYGP